MSYQFIGAAATHFQITGASFYNFVVGSVTVLVSIRKLDDWDVVTTTSDRAHWSGGGREHGHTTSTRLIVWSHLVEGYLMRAGV